VGAEDVGEEGALGGGGGEEGELGGVQLLHTLMVVDHQAHGQVDQWSDAAVLPNALQDRGTAGHGRVERCSTEAVSNRGQDDHCFCPQMIFFFQIITAPQDECEVVSHT